MPGDNEPIRLDRDIIWEELMTAVPLVLSASPMRFRWEAGAGAALWHKRPAYKVTPWRYQRSGQRGPASLLDMAVKVVADNIGRVDVDALRRCPDALVWRVWYYLDHRKRSVPRYIYPPATPVRNAEFFDLCFWMSFQRAQFSLLEDYSAGAARSRASAYRRRAAAFAVSCTALLSFLAG